MAYDPLVFTRQALLMQRLSDYVRHNYHYWTAGTVPLTRAQALSQKFEVRYRVYATESQRRYARQHGRANAFLLLFASENRTELRWFLLVSEGTGCVHEEVLRDARNSRERLRTFEDRYELLQLTRPKHQGGGTTWTWRMTRETFDHYDYRAIAAARSSAPVAAQRLSHELARTPGFSGVRRQVGRLMKRMRGEWVRRGMKRWPFHEIPKLHYLERMETTGIRLSELCQQNAAPEDKGRALDRA